MATYLVTGGAGYIGSHTCVELLGAGHTAVVLDNFSNSSALAVRSVERISGRSMVAHNADIRDRSALDRIFSEHAFDGVLHFAGLKSVGESVAQPLDYYDNNVAGTLTLLSAMRAAGVRRMVFSSSATVYGVPQSVPLTESAPVSPINPYGRTKAQVEDILADVFCSEPGWSLARLRYFNPVGAHPSGLIGEDPRGVPSNLAPYIAQVAVGARPFLRVFGNDYPTPDGTGVRDFIHVVDLARAHVKAIDALVPVGQLLTLNLGTGVGYSVLEMLRAFELASGRSIPYQVLPRRAGDVAACWADPALAAQVLGWRAEKSLLDMCADAWRWQNANPGGFQG